MAVIKDILLKPNELQLVRSLIREYMPNVEVRAFGSRVRGNARASSDLDIVLLASPDQVTAVEDLKEAFEQSDLPFRVDCHIWSELPEPFQEIISGGYCVLGN